MDLTTTTTKQLPSTVTTDDETEGSESDTPMVDCNPIDERYIQLPSEESEYSDTSSESLLKPREESNICNILGINVSVNEVNVDINQMIENCVISDKVISTNMMMDTDDGQEENVKNSSPSLPNTELNVENTAMGINVNLNINVDVTSCEKAVMGKNVSASNVSLAQNAVLSVGKANTVMGINLDSTTKKAPHVNVEMGKNVESNNTSDNTANAAMGINVSTENTDQCVKNAAMGINSDLTIKHGSTSSPSMSLPPAPVSMVPPLVLACG